MFHSIYIANRFASFIGELLTYDFIIIIINALFLNEKTNTNKLFCELLYIKCISVDEGGENFAQ